MLILKVTKSLKFAFIIVHKSQFLFIYPQWTFSQSNNAISHQLASSFLVNSQMYLKSIWK